MRDVLKYIVVAIVGLALTSCNTIYDNGVCLAVDEPREVNFVLAIDSPGSTRAEWGETEPTDQIGTTFENKINPESLRVAVYTSDNNHLGDVENLQHWAINNENTLYQFHGTLPTAVVEQLQSGEQYRFMVFANTSGVADSGLLYSLSNLNMESGAIPMWGVKQVELSELVGGRSTHLGTISLLRAAAKVEVELDAALANVELDKVSLNYYNGQGYVLPTGWDVVADTNNIDREGGFRGYSSVDVAPLNFVEVEQDRKFVIYIPEYDNTLYPLYEAKLSVDVTTNSTTLSFPDALHFKSYVAGRPTGEASKIARNTIYRFRITGVAKGNLELTYQVADWQVGGDWDYGEFAYPTYHNPVLPYELYNSGNITGAITTPPTMSYNATDEEAGAFSVWFYMSAPVGQHWVPTLRQSDSDYEVRVYQKGARITDMSQLVASSDWYNIKIVPLKPERVGNVVDFGISYTASWMDPSSSMFLFINGHLGDIAWPESGDDPKIIRIKQI